MTFSQLKGKHRLTSSIKTWRPGINEPYNEQAFATISDWWFQLSGQRAHWDIFVGMEVTSCISYECTIEEASLSSEFLCWHKRGHQSSNIVPLKELYLDLELQELTIIPDAFGELKYRVRPCSSAA